MGDAIFVVDGDRAASPVIFGERGDSILLGTVSLESLGFVLDPIKRVLRPLPMVLGSHSAPLIGRLKGKIRIRGNILSTGLRWNARPRRAHSA